MAIILNNKGISSVIGTACHIMALVMTALFALLTQYSLAADADQKKKPVFGYHFEFNIEERNAGFTNAGVFIDFYQMDKMPLKDKLGRGYILRDVGEGEPHSGGSLKCEDGDFEVKYEVSKFALGKPLKVKGEGNEIQTPAWQGEQVFYVDVYNDGSLAGAGFTAINEGIPLVRPKNDMTTLEACISTNIFDFQGNAQDGPYQHCSYLWQGVNYVYHC